MWKVASFSDGNWTEVEPIELVGQVPTTSDVLKLAAEKLPQNLKHLLGHLESESQLETETILDWRGYFGRESAVIDGWTMMRSQGHGYVASFTGTFGFVVGHVVRRLVRPQKPWKKDPTARGRLTRLSEKYRE